MEGGSDLMPVNVWLAGRSYRIRISASEEGRIRRAVKAADEQITQMRAHYAGRDDQDFVAMCLLLYATEQKEAAVMQDGIDIDADRRIAAIAQSLERLLAKGSDDSSCV